MTKSIQPSSLSKLIGAAIFFLGITLMMGCRCDSNALVHNDWILEQYGPAADPIDAFDPATVTPPGTKEIRLTFGDEQRFGGNDGCNTIFGAYELGSSCQINFDSIGSTLMMCQQEIMQQADAYTTILKKVESYTIDGNELKLMTPDQQLLRYRKQ